MRAGATLLCIGIVGAAFAGPTGCIQMPIADIIKHREVFLYGGFFGTERDVSKTTTRFLSANLGLFNRVEFGVDGFSEAEPLYHAKFSLYEDKKKDFGFSAGWMNWSPSTKRSDFYMVGRYGLENGPRLHFGTVRNDRWRTMLGADYAMGPITFAADWISGPNSTLWTGLTYNFKEVPGLSVSGFVGFPSVRDNGIQHSFFVNYLFRF